MVSNHNKDFFANLEVVSLAGGYLVLGQFFPGAYTDDLYAAYKIEFPPAHAAQCKATGGVYCRPYCCQAWLEQLQFHKMKLP